MYKHVDSNIGISLMAIEYPFGGSTEKTGECGISHLMEHLLCKMYDDLLQVMKASRVDYDAFTATTKTVFLFEGLDDELKNFSSIFFDRITQHGHIYSKNEFENEKKTVIQEYKDCFNDQQQGSYYNFLRKYYNSCEAIGLLSDIENFTYEQSLELLNRYSLPCNVYEVGISCLSNKNISYSEIFAEESICFNELGYNLPLENVPKEEKTIVGIIGKETASSNGEAQKLGLVMDCLSDGLESPLYQEIREKRGLSYYVLSYLSNHKKRFFSSFFSGTTNENEKVLKEVFVDFFSKEFCERVSYERFSTCKKYSMLGKKLNSLLPHKELTHVDLAEFNPYIGIDNFTYDEAKEIASKFLTINSMHLVSY